MPIWSHVSFALALARLFHSHELQEVLQELGVETYLGMNLLTEGRYIKKDSSMPRRLSACVGEAGKECDGKKHGVIWLGQGSCQVAESVLKSVYCFLCTRQNCL